MSRQFWFNLMIMVCGLFAAYVVLFAFITQILSMDFIAIQWLYGLLDSSAVVIRATIMIFFFLGGVIVIIIYGNKLPARNISVTGLSMIVIGLVLGLSIIYDASCCDTPVSFYLGFPLSWLRGISMAQHYLPMPMMQYLTQNISTIDWYVDFFSFFMDILFWYTIGIIAYIIWPKKKNKGISKRTLPV